MHTKDMLAEALRGVGLDEMADRAATGWYHDYLSPLDAPCMTLANDLAVAMKKHPAQSPEIMALRQRVINGDFDASGEESDEWAASPEGIETLGGLMPKRSA
jgi:hypothetical protein